MSKWCVICLESIVYISSLPTTYLLPAPFTKIVLLRNTYRRDLNTYGSRRGNDEIMTRGTFANIRLVNNFLKGEIGPKTIHVPSREKMWVYDAAMKYKAAGIDTIILAGEEYGSGSSRDWAAKGPYLQGIKAVIVKSFEQIHRSNLIGMCVIPLCFKPGEDADSLGLTGYERYTIDLPSDVKDIAPGQDIIVKTNDGKIFSCVLRIDTKVELSYFSHGGILHYVARKLIGQNH